jgi:hypothetical protein
MHNQNPLFDAKGTPAPPTKQCERCAKRCRVVDKKNPNANYFVRGDMKTGRFCAECLIVDFFKNFDLGPSSALGAEYFDHSLPQPEWRSEVGDKYQRFNPEWLRLPHIQEQLRRIIEVAAAKHGAELSFDEVDWDEVIANWHLPFPKKGRGRKKKE